MKTETKTMLCLTNEEVEIIFRAEQLLDRITELQSLDLLMQTKIECASEDLMFIRLHSLNEEKQKSLQQNTNSDYKKGYSAGYSAGYEAGVIDA